MKETRLEKWKRDLANRKPVAVLILVATIIIGTGTAIGSLKVIWDVGAKVIFQIGEWCHTAEKENQKLEEQKRKYFEVKEVADKVFIEVLANLKKIDLVLNNKNDINLRGDNLIFQFSSHDKWYANFGIGELDRQIDNFYVSLKNSDIGYSLEDWKIIKGQGEDVKRLLGQYFCCSDYYQASTLQTNAVSQDSVVLASQVDVTKVASGVTVGVSFNSSCFDNYRLAEINKLK